MPCKSLHHGKWKKTGKRVPVLPPMASNSTSLSLTLFHLPRRIRMHFHLWKFIHFSWRTSHPKNEISMVIAFYARSELNQKWTYNQKPKYILIRHDVYKRFSEKGMRFGCFFIANDRLKDGNSHGEMILDGFAMGLFPIKISISWNIFSINVVAFIESGKNTNRVCLLQLEPCVSLRKNVLSTKPTTSMPIHT